MKLTTKKKILMALGTIADEAFDWIDLISMTPSQYSRKSSKERYYCRQIAEELSKIGDIEKKIVKGKVVLRFTSRGWDKLVFTFPVFRYTNKKWDGWWTIVSYDIPEEERALRDRLRRKLKQLTFGQYQQSVWITTHPVEEEMLEFIKGVGLTSLVHAYRTKQISGNPKEIAIGAWDLNRLNRRYTRFVERWRKKLVGKTVKQVKEELFDDMSEEYGEILLDDPGLPKELLPKGWQGNKARNLVRYFYKT